MAHTNQSIDPTAPAERSMKKKYAIRPASTVSTMSCSRFPASPKGSTQRLPRSHVAVAVAVVLGAIFYGLNNTTVEQGGHLDG